MNFAEAYTNNPEQLRRDRDHWLGKARAQSHLAHRYASTAMRTKDDTIYTRTTKASAYHFDMCEIYVHAARKLNWHLLRCLKQHPLF